MLLLACFNPSARQHAAKSGQRVMQYRPAEKCRHIGKIRSVRREASVAYRAIGEEDAIWVHLQDLAGGVVSRHHCQPAAERGQPPQNVVLDAKVICHNLRVRKKSQPLRSITPCHKEARRLLPLHDS